MTRKATALITAASFFLASVAPAFAQAPAISKAEYEACQTQDEAVFRQAIRAITLNALRKGTLTIDYDALVRDQWRKHKLEEVVDKRVDLAVAEVRSETSWGQLLKSLAYRDKARELATAVAERVYRSDAMKAALETMAVGVGQDIGRAIELTTSDAAIPAQRCVQAFLGPRYGQTVAKAVIGDTGRAFQLDPNDNAAAISGTSVVKTASGGIAGAVILLVRRQLTRMAQRIGQRLVGAILGRLVAVVAGGVGVVLIAKDVWDLRFGVLPIVATEMKSEETKAKVRTELATAIRQQVTGQLDVLADNTSERIVDIWRDFRRAHAKLLEIAAKNTKFKEFVDTAGAGQMARLDEVVSLILQEDGEPGIVRRLGDGTLHRAVRDMPEQGMQIARELGELSTALAWATLAPGQIGEVIRHDLHRRATPSSFSKASLARLVSLEDPLVVARLAGLTRAARDVLFDLGNDRLVTLARGMEARELETLTGYITNLAPTARQKVLSTVAQEPAKMRVLASPRVRDAVLSSSNQNAAVQMMLRSDKGFNLGVVQADLQLVLDRQINPILMWDKHPIAIVAAGLALLLVLLIIRRLLFVPRRRRTVAAPTEN